jgi:16S rRNA (uracil1498-N3)-methyltransferase
MSRRRFLVASPPERGRALLDPEASKHAVKVLRLAEGDGVVLFDGKGTEWDGVVARASRKGVLVEAGEARASARPPGPRVVLATAIPKGKRMSTLVSMATEAGAEGIVPVAFARSAVRGAGPSKVAHWARAIEEAARQCGRPWLPALEPEVPAAEFLARPRGEGERRFLPTTVGNPPGILAVLARGPAPATAVLLVGPEGGFTADEARAASEAGFEPCSLGAHVLRVETAGVTGVAILRVAGGA